MNAFAENKPRFANKVALALIALAVLPYLQTLNHDFVNYDDNFYITENPHVQQGLTWPGTVWAFTTFKGGNWHPLTWLSHMFDVTLSGVTPGGMHFTNALLHAGNTLLVFWFLILMTNTRPATAGGTIAPCVWRSALVAALFAVHPLHVESVAWIAERKDVLSALFGLLALCAYASYAREPAARRYLVVAGLFVCSLMSKPMLVTFPFLLLLLDIWPLQRWKVWSIENRQLSGASEPRFAQRSDYSVLVEKVPLLILSAIFSALAIVSQRSAGNISSFEIVPLSSRIKNAIVGYDLYIEKLIAPVNLAVFYPRPPYWRISVVAMGAALLVVVTAIAVAQRRKRPWFFVGWFWFVGMLIPVIGLIQVGLQAIADRYAYLPSIGIFIMVAWSIPETLSPFWKRALISAPCIAIIALTITTWVQVSHWRDSRTLFTHALEVTRDNFIAHQNLGNVLEKEKNLDGALEQYRTAAAEHPKYARVHENIANILIQETRYEDAFAELKHAIDLDPLSSSAFNSMGSLMIIGQRYDEAARYLQHAVELDPDNVLAHINFGTSLVKLGRWSEAIAQLAPITQSEPKRIVARTNLGLAFAGNGDRDRARSELRGVLQIAPDYAPAREALAKIESQ